MIERFGLMLIRVGEWLVGYRLTRKVIVHVDSEQTMLDYVCQERLRSF